MFLSRRKLRGSELSLRAERRFTQPARGGDARPSRAGGGGATTGAQSRVLMSCVCFSCRHARHANLVERGSTKPDLFNRIGSTTSRYVVWLKSRAKNCSHLSSCRFRGARLSFRSGAGPLIFCKPPSQLSWMRREGGCCKQIGCQIDLSLPGF